jgi:hypothetical protein
MEGVEIMGFRFRRSIKILPGLKVNLGKTGFTSVSVGGHGLTTNYGKKGTRTTVGLPGTGLSYSTYSPKQKANSNQQNQPSPPGTVQTAKPVWVRIAIFIAVVGAFIAYVTR